MNTSEEIPITRVTDTGVKRINDAFLTEMPFRACP